MPETSPTTFLLRITLDASPALQGLLHRLLDVAGLADKPTAVAQKPAAATLKAVKAPAPEALDDELPDLEPGEYMESVEWDDAAEEPAAPPKRGRGRPRKTPPPPAELAPAPAATPTKPSAVGRAEAPKSVPATAPAAPAKQHSLTDLKSALRAHVGTPGNSIETARVIFTKHGFANISEVPADRYAVLITELNFES